MHIFLFSVIISILSTSANAYSPSSSHHIRRRRLSAIHHPKIDAGFVKLIDLRMSAPKKDNDQENILRSSDITKPLEMAQIDRSENISMYDVELLPSSAIPVSNSSQLSAMPATETITTTTAHRHRVHRRKKHDQAKDCLLVINL